MRSRTERAAAKPARNGLLLWNRKIHFYLGLYFLFFVWLFGFTGLLLNHPAWKFAEFWPNRKTSQFERSIELPASGSDLERARSIARQLGIRGEIEWTVSSAEWPLREFRVGRPGHILTITLHPERKRARVEQIEINGWGILHVLHTFTGVRAGDDRNQRDWILTKIWAFSMDAVSAALIVMVLTGIYLWYGMPGKRIPGGLALLLGTLTCALFVVGLRWLSS
ncbi:MAG TPA: hypothetical protein VHA11_12905 [Bryobacteraceae bacterium]|nr:hypothetical protein [Bryobacteraceae bacterium]